MKLYRHKYADKALEPALMERLLYLGMHLVNRDALRSAKRMRDQKMNLRILHVPATS